MLESRIKVAIVDDHQIMRDALAHLINADGRFEIIFTSGNGVEMIKDLSSGWAQPDIIILDIKMPVMDGFQSVEWLKKHYPKTKILVLSMHTGGEYIVRMFKLGASSYLTKNASKEEILNCLHLLSVNESYYSASTTDKIIEYLQNEKAIAEDDTETKIKHVWDSLSDKERDLVRLSCIEISYKEIAALLSLSPRTVETMRANIFERFNVKSRVGLIMLITKYRILKEAEAEQ